MIGKTLGQQSKFLGPMSLAIVGNWACLLQWCTESSLGGVGASTNMYFQMATRFDKCYPLVIAQCCGNTGTPFIAKNPPPVGTHVLLCNT